MYQRSKMGVKLFAPSMALMGYGSWSAWLNIAAHNDHWWRAGVSHGLYAFVFTWIFRALTLRLLLWLKSWRCPRLLAFLLMAGLIILLPLVNQWLAGNQTIGLTILPGVIVGLGYLSWLLVVTAGPTPAVSVSGGCLRNRQPGELERPVD